MLAVISGQIESHLISSQASRTIDDVINQAVGKILDHFGVEHMLFKRWK